MKGKLKTTAKTYAKPLRWKRNELVQPFLKWAGGKRQLLSVLREFVPQEMKKNYYEPFIGAGALLFDLQPKQAVLNDFNSELVNCYTCIKNEPEELIRLCTQLRSKHSEEHFYQLRQQDRDSDFNKRPAVQRAARILYLNKTCFNGLFRVNSQGQFNVPFGDYANPLIADRSVIKAVSLYLNTAKVDIKCGDFKVAVKNARKGDFIYFDPPYDPLSDTSSFTGYSLNSFNKHEQTRLKLTCDELSDRGCNVLISNSSTDFIKDLYSDSRYTIVEVQAKRAINSVGAKRGKITEVLIFNNYERKGPGKGSSMGSLI